MKKISEMTDKDKKRFFAKITINPKTQCHEWIAALGAGDYGLFRVGSYDMMQKAHRIAYQLHHETDLPYGNRNFMVLHKCDNPKCCNPEHLFLGNQMDNMRDMAAKGRGSTHGVPPVLKGSRNSHAIVTEADIPTIRAEFAKIRKYPPTIGKQKAYAKLGKEYGISGASVVDIGTRRSWKHIS